MVQYYFQQDVVVPKGFQFEYYNYEFQRYETSPDLSLPITNYAYEHLKEDAEEKYFCNQTRICSSCYE